MACIRGAKVENCTDAGVTAVSVSGTTPKAKIILCGWCC